MKETQKDTPNKESQPTDKLREMSREVNSVGLQKRRHRHSAKNMMNVCGKTKIKRNTDFENA